MNTWETLAEKLKDARGSTVVGTSNIEAFLKMFSRCNPHLQVEAKPIENEPNRYQLIIVN